MGKLSNFVTRGILLATTIVSFAGVAAAQTDVLRIGAGTTATCELATFTMTPAGFVTNIPIFIDDNPGTPAGFDRPTADQIQNVTFRIDFSGSGAAKVVGCTSTGCSGFVILDSTQALDAINRSPSGSALVASSPGTATSRSYIRSFEVPLTTVDTGTGVALANLRITLSSPLAAGERIDLIFEPTLANLTDLDNTSPETPANGFLTILNDCIAVPAVVTTTALACPAPFQTGTNGVGTVTLSSAQASATTITLVSGTPGVATVPANVIVAAGATMATFNIAGVSAGTSVITATPPGGLGTAQNCTATVNAAPVVTTAIACPVGTVFVGTPRTGTVTLSTAQGTPTTVTLSSATPGVATVPANVVIAAGATSATFTVTAVSAGTSVITATPPGGLGTAQNCTVTAGTATAVTVGAGSGGACGAAFPANSSATASVSIGTAQATATTINLTSGTPGNATVPATVTIAAGATTATFTITGVAQGTSTITATLPAGVGGGTSTCVATLGAAVGAGIPTVNPLGLALMASLLALAGYFVSSKMS